MKRITLNGVRYHLDLAGEIDGCVDIITSNTPTLMLCRDLSTLSGLNTVLHEACHVFFPTATEEKVTRFGNDVSRLLWGLGYRYREDKR
jgi:hypothetical protein